MRTIQIDRDLLLALVTFAESRSMQARLEAAQLSVDFDADATPEKHRRWAEADDLARRALSAVQRGNALLYPRAPQEVPGVVVERHPASEPPVEGLVSVIDPECACGNPLPGFVVPAVNHRGQRVCFACEGEQVAARDARRPEARLTLVGPVEVASESSKS